MVTTALDPFGTDLDPEAGKAHWDFASAPQRKSKLRT
jgi:hypothetical protein